MDPTVVWALLTGAVTGGAWVGIVLFRRQERTLAEQLRLFDEVEQRLEELAEVGNRLAEAEERLDHAERLLSQAPTQIREQQ